MTRASKTQTISSVIPHSEIREIIERGSRILVVSHIDPDGDAIGSQLAFAAYLKHLNKDVVLVRDRDIPAKYQFLDGVQNILAFNSLPADTRVDTAVLLECPSFERIGQAASLLGDDVTIICIDHHRDSSALGVVNWIEPERSSVGEMVYEYLAAVGYEIDASVATQLYTAILTDTGRFRYKSTSPRTMQVAGELIRAGADSSAICDHVYYELSQSTMRLTARVLNTIEFHHKDSVCVLSLTRAMLTESGADSSESDGLVDYSLLTGGVDVGVLLKEHDATNTRVSLRSRDGVNVAAIAARFGGGGHFNASGCSIPKNVTDAKKELLQLLEKI